MKSEHYYTIESGYHIFFSKFLVSKRSSVKGKILIIHGLGEHSGRYKDLAEFLCKNGYDVYIPDLIGHGKSEGSRGYIVNFKFFIDMIDELIEKIIKPDQLQIPLSLYGHSMGAVIAGTYALTYRHKIHTLILSAIGLSIGKKMKSMLIPIVPIIAFLFPRAHFSNRINPKWISSDMNVVKSYINDPYTFSFITPQLFIQYTTAYKHLIKNLSFLTIPIFYLFGKKDFIISQSDQFFALLGSKLKKKFDYENALHEPHNEILSIREKVFADVLHFLTTCHPE